MHERPPRANARRDDFTAAFLASLRVCQKFNPSYFVVMSFALRTSAFCQSCRRDDTEKREHRLFE
jgi:hypothetical protein